MGEKFSVLLSVYDKEQTMFLKQSLDSILCQTVLPSEIILVKDGELSSELNSMIASYQVKYPIIKTIQIAHSGLAKALNEGLKRCSFDLVARMDTDDIAKPDRFEKQLMVFKVYPQIDVCSSWIDEFEDSPDNIVSTKKLPETHEEIFQYAKHRCPINHPVVMYRKSAVEKVGGYTDFPEDYNLWVNLLIHGFRFYNIQESLLLFRFSNAMIKRRGGWKYAKADISSQIRFYKIGFLSVSNLVYNLLIRIIVRLMPNSVRFWIYRDWLRK